MNKNIYSIQTSQMHPSAPSPQAGLWSWTITCLDTAGNLRNVASCGRVSYPDEQSAWNAAYPTLAMFRRQEGNR